MFFTRPPLSLMLLTSRKNSLFEFVSEPQMDCPGELLAKARGETLFKDENTMVRRLCNCPKGSWVPPPREPGSPGSAGVAFIQKQTGREQSLPGRTPAAGTLPGCFCLSFTSSTFHPSPAPYLPLLSSFPCTNLETFLIYQELR